MIKKLLMIATLALTLFAAEPIQYGAYYGNIKIVINNWNSYPSNNASSAGLLYLFKEKKDIVNYIYETKIEHIKSALQEAKEFARENKNKYYAIDNVAHSISITENSVIVLTDYNILSFD